MAFENFPYTNFHEINLDWIVARVKEAYSASNPPDYPVKSVNGMTGDVIIAIPSALVRTVNGESGDVILYRNPLVQFPTTDESRWNLFRICDGNSGDARGIEFDEDGAHRIEGVRRILIYDEENQPDFPVTSVNGQTGDVQIIAGVNSVNGKTGNVVTPFVNPNADILTLDSNSNTVLWGISRNVAGGNVALYISRGTGTPQAFIRYTPDQGEAVNLPLLSSADIPESAGVVSINSKTGVVTLYGTDILLSSESGDTVTQKILTEIADRLQADNNLTYKINTIFDSLFTPESAAWENGGIRASNGTSYAISDTIRTANIIPENIVCILNNDEDTNRAIRIYGYENGQFMGILHYPDLTFSSESSNTGVDRNRYNIVNIAELRKLYPTYEYRIAVSLANPQSPYDQYMTCYGVENTDISSIEEDIVDLQNADATHNQQISALQAEDSTHDQQIAALQAEDTSLAQQISALQTADSTHDQQISALQASQATQDQQISELYTRAGVYVVSISNANTLPLRYPASGTDSKIKGTNKVVSMDLSIPGAQTSNWTITTYDGYLEITGTITGSSDITLYLA